MIAPGLYLGDVMHRRLIAPAHRFRYGAFWFALDLDELEAQNARLRLFSVERRNLFSFHARDHADGRPGDLRAKVTAISEGIDVSGRMILLTMPRLFGFVFNPLSVYFCHNCAARPSAIAWEVSNTFGGRHTYVLPVSGGGVVRQSCAKRLHVSPFLGMDYRYRFRVETNGDSLRIGIVDEGAEGPAMVAALAATRRDLSDRALLALAARSPLATLKVVAAIHWEAFRLWRKGAPFHRAPAGSTGASA